MQSTGHSIEHSASTPNVVQVKTSSDWMSLFLGSRSGQGLESPSIYDKVTDNSCHNKPAMYERSYPTRSYSTSGSALGTSYSSRYYSGVASSYLSSASTSTSRFSRSLSYQSGYNYRTRHLHDDEDEENNATANRKSTKDTNNNSRKMDTATREAIKEEEESKGNSGKRENNRKVTTVMNGNVIRIRRQRAADTSDEDISSDSEEESEESEEGEKAGEDTVDDNNGYGSSAANAPIRQAPQEDPLDVEERMLNAQLTLSLTLTLTDEENIRQRLMEIKKTRAKRNAADVERGLIEKFDQKTEELFESNRAKEEEEKILTNRLNAETIREVEQKDIQVRLQEIFRDRKSALEVTQKNMETHYEHMLQETSTEICELENSIRGKQMQVEKLQDEILSMTVKKELLSTGIEKINHRHQEQVEQLKCQKQELEGKISQYAVLAPAPLPRKPSTVDSEQIHELEQELECPICMDISRPPIYQCEEGHIICSSCKPLLTNCPHCNKKYSNPVIRCRFAEKLSEKYFSLVAEQEENLMH